MKSNIARLNKFETGFYFFTWTFGIFYGIYQLYLAGSYFKEYEDPFNDFTTGWSWIGKNRDVSDIEWSLWIPFTHRIIPWIIVHFLISQLLKSYKQSSTVICSWYILISMIFLWNYAGWICMIIMLTQPCIACLLTSFRSKKIAYIIHFATLGVLQLTSVLDIVLRNWLTLENDIYHMLIVAICWIQLRNISCSIDNINDYKHNNIIGFFKNFIQSTAYCLYLPTLFIGPFFLYSDFIKGINQPFKKWTLKRIIFFIINLARYTFWLYFTEFSMHFIYCNAFQYHPDEVAKLNSWAFYGMGYCMGQYFHNKYVVFYGLYGEIGRGDDIDVPLTPKCIGRIHLYSEMWKYFDRGLYQFLTRYIYIPILSLNLPLNKLLASFMSFGFVFIWHGVDRFIFTWSLMNFLGLSLEGFIKTIGKTDKYIEIESKFSSINIRRFHCLIASPLLALSAISNFYFFAGQEIGNIYLYRLFHDSPQIIGTLLFFLYCCCQVSTEVKLYEKKNKIDMNLLKKI